MKIVDKQFTGATATGFTAILTAIRAKKPDLIFFGGMDAVAGPMLEQMKTLGITARFMGGEGACTEALGRLLGDAVGVRRHLNGALTLYTYKGGKRTLMDVIR